MDIGIVGLGRMGANIARRLMRAGHGCVVYDRNKLAVDELAKEGGRPATSLADLVSQLPKPCAVWLMLPAGAITQSSVDEASELLQPQDALIDGGNTFYKDDIRRAEKLEQRQVHYIDVGTSGGVWGLERGLLHDDRRTSRRRAPSRPNLCRSCARCGVDYAKQSSAPSAIRASSRAICIADPPAPVTL